VDAERCEPWQQGAPALTQGARLVCQHTGVVGSSRESGVDMRRSPALPQRMPVLLALHCARTLARSGLAGSPPFAQRPTPTEADRGMAGTAARGRRACSSNWVFRIDFHSRPMNASEGAAAGGNTCLKSGATRPSPAARAAVRLPWGRGASFVGDKCVAPALFRAGQALG